MKTALLSTVLIFFSMIAMDALWLSLMFKPFYIPQIGHLLSGSMQIGPVLIFYVLYAFALYVFVVGPELKNNQGFLQLILLAVLFGLTAYGTYDLTNQATLKGWSSFMTMVDMAWGGFLTGATCVIATSLVRYFS